jgi:CubicO group peptidase (beta-lactamase class C family)
VSPEADPVRGWLESRVAAGVTPGGAWWIETGAGVLSHGAAGDASRIPSTEAATERTPYDLASLTKPLATGLLAALLEQEGRLDLEAPVVEWVDELHGSRYETASLLELGAHRSGLSAWQPLYLEVSSLEGYLWRIAAGEPAVPRGAELYSDLGFIVLGAAVERAGEAPLDRLFQNRVAGPLGLDMRFARRPDRIDGAAPTEEGNAHERSLAGEAGEGHAWRTGMIRGEVHDGNAWALGGVAGHAGLFGDVTEVATLGREIIAPDRLALGSVARRRLLETAGGRGGRTFGFVTAGESDAARGVFPDGAPGHAGFTGTSLWLDPDRQLVAVLLCNRVHPAVQPIDFQQERLAFHRLATGLG